MLPSHADTAQPVRSAREQALVREMLASRIVARADIPATLEVSVGGGYTELEAEVEVETEVQASRWWSRSRIRDGRVGARRQGGLAVRSPDRRAARR